MINPIKDASFKLAFGLNNKNNKFHKGIDLEILTDMPVLATADGIIHISQHKDNGGNYSLILIEHSKNLQTVYKHLNNVIIKDGQKVKSGQFLGYMGNPNKATKGHLHLELIKDNKRINPEDYIKFN